LREGVQGLVQDRPVVLLDASPQDLDQADQLVEGRLRVLRRIVLRADLADVVRSVDLEVVADLPDPAWP
ncbi:hypothetical protein VR46_30555, partial [Streptomyces sp. NRRL S-444]